MKTRCYVMVGAVLTVLGCSSREVPASFPASSPASPSATEAPHAEVARSLREDPPLPGASTEGWAGLAVEDAPAARDHEHEHGATVYTCPMHPEVTSDKPATCPKCGMKLEPKQP